MELNEAQGKKYYHFDFLPYCKLMHYQQFQEAVTELERLVSAVSTINEWWAKRENVPLAAARAYEAYVLCQDLLNTGETIDRIFYDEGQPRVVKKR